MNFAGLGNAKYIALETFRKNGEGVNTPVWVTSENDKLYAWTVDDSWKVKRIRNNERVRIAVSDARGNPQSDWVEATAKVLDSPEAEVHQSDLMAAKYGWSFRMFQLTYKFRRNMKQRVVVEISEVSDNIDIPAADKNADDRNSGNEERHE